MVLFGIVSVVEGGSEFDPFSSQLRFPLIFTRDGE